MAQAAHRHRLLLLFQVAAAASTQFEGWRTARPIGHICSVFPSKFGTPRQGSVTPDARASLRVVLDDGLDACHALEGLEEFSHVWLLWAADGAAAPP